MARMSHPLAGKTGEGPPIAPPNWKWRAGNRMSDMYFYSPSGKQFRSRPELANYLPTLDNPPDANLFCWRVTDEGEAQSFHAISPCCYLHCTVLASVRRFFGDYVIGSRFSYESGILVFS